MKYNPENGTATGERLRQKQSVLLAGMMLLDEKNSLPPGTIRFFAGAYPVFLNKVRAGATEMAELAGMSTPAATEHLRRLVNSGYLKRVNYRNWELKTDKIEEMNRGDFNNGSN